LGANLPSNSHNSKERDLPAATIYPHPPIQAEKMRTELRKLALNLEIVGHTTAAIWLFA
jgi:hypothetical protein